MPRCPECKFSTVLLSLLSDHRCDVHNTDCPEYDDLDDPEGLYE